MGENRQISVGFAHNSLDYARAVAHTRSMNKLSMERRVQIIRALVEGNSIRAVCRIMGTEKRTVTRLLVEVGAAAFEYQNRVLRNLPCKRIQCDEIWSYVGCKQRNVTPAMDETRVGDAWVWVAIDADTKLVPCWTVGKREPEIAAEFIADLASRLSRRVQLTTDGHRVYLNAVEDAFGADIDYAMLVKSFVATSTGESRYSPAKFVTTEKIKVSGSPEDKHISTSYIERQNLTMRMGMRRFTRLTNGFSKKIENHEASVALHFLHYNFARVHQTLRVTPAMEAGLSSHIWSFEEIVGLADARQMERAA
jgi:IS1 family transposase